MNVVNISGKVKFVDEVREFGAATVSANIDCCGNRGWPLGQPNSVEFTKENIELSKILQVGDEVEIQS